MPYLFRRRLQFLDCDIGNHNSKSSLPHFVKELAALHFKRRVKAPSEHRCIGVHPQFPHTSHYPLPAALPPILPMEADTKPECIRAGETACPAEQHSRNQKSGLQESARPPSDAGLHTVD